MAIKYCATCGAEFIDPGGGAKYCKPHRKDGGRYNGEHKRIRAEGLANLVEGTPCARCGQPMFSFQRLHLDHTDDGRGYLGFSHETCNTSAGGRKGSAAKEPEKHCDFHTDCIVGRHTRDWL